MSAETLRRAAALMRRDAENATPGRWKLWGMTVMADQDGSSNVDTAAGVAQTYFRDEHGKPRTWDASHICGMQPAVALAVADLLDNEANAMARADGFARDYAEVQTAAYNEARRSLLLAVARAYLQEVSDV